MPERDRVLADVLSTFVSHSHLVTGDGIPAMLDEVLKPTGLRSEIFLVDHEQSELRPLRDGPGASLRVDGTLPGRGYQHGTVLSGTDTDGTTVLWVPLVDGVERLGVVRFGLDAGTDPRDEQLREWAARLCGLTAHVIMSKLPQSDRLAIVRRAQPMSMAGELLWRLLPPLTTASDKLAIAAVLEPSYDVSGDAFDYTIGSDTARFAIFDSSGHDLNAGLTTSVTLAASRAARRGGADLDEVATLIDAALIDEFTDHRFVTGVLAHLDLDTGRLRYVCAGHPRPVLLRAGRAVRELTDAQRMPFGRVSMLATQPTTIAEEDLEPGDLLLLYSDGVVEARGVDGAEFGVHRLIEMAEHAAADQLPAPETLRRLATAVRDYRSGELADDATLMLVEWSGSAGDRLLPHTADTP